MRDYRWQRDFDEEFDKTARWFGVWAVIVLLLVLGLLAGIGFVVYKLLLHFGVL